MKSFEGFSSKEKHYAIFGLVLGDGTYRSYKEGYVHISHTQPQEFYNRWLESLFVSWNFQVKSKYNDIKETNYGIYEYSHLYVKLPKRRHFENQRIYNNEGKKIFSTYVEKRITPLGLLFWYLDDGSLCVSEKENKTSRFAHLNTQNFSYTDNEKISKCLKDRFGIGTKIHKDRKYFRLYLNAENFRKFYDIVRIYLPYIPNEFQYKFDMRYSPNRLKNSTELSEKYNFVF